MINGIPVKIKTADDKGELTNVETVYFASFRKCPELSALARAHLEASGEYAVKDARKNLAERALYAAQNSAEVDQAAAAYKEALNALDDQNQKIIDCFRALVDKGLSAAGYAPADIERYGLYIVPDRFLELLNKARLGAGRVDFS
jgi:hypothetical protein